MPGQRNVSCSPVQERLKEKHAYKSHILTKKSTKRKRNLTYWGLVADVDTHHVKRLLAMR